MWQEDQCHRVGHRTRENPTLLLAFVTGGDYVASCMGSHEIKLQV